jgi:hypothetical protein
MLVDWNIWLAIIGGAVVSIFFMEKMTWRNSTVHAAAGIFLAYIFHKPVIAILGWDFETYKIAVAAALAATGADVIRTILHMIRNPMEYMRVLLEAWKGKSNGK